MNSNVHALTDYTDAIANLPQEAFLGMLFWYTISEADVNLDDAKQALAAAGLPPLNKTLRPVDAFKKSCNLIKKKFKPVNNVRSEFMVRTAGDEKADPLKRMVILERNKYQDGQRVQLFYDRVAELTFTRGTKKNGQYTGYNVTARRTTGNLTDPLTVEEDLYLTESLDSFQYNFDHLMHFMDSHAVRTFTADYLDSLGSTLVKRSGGLYFVRQAHAPEVRALGEWIRAIGSEFKGVDLLNLAEERQMILEAFEDETVREVERLMAELAKILKDPSRTIEEKTFDEYGLRVAELKQKITEYNETLGMRASRATLEVNAYAAQVMALAQRIRQPQPRKVAS